MPRDIPVVLAQLMTLPTGPCGGVIKVSTTPHWLFLNWQAGSVSFGSQNVAENAKEQIYTKNNNRKLIIVLKMLFSKYNKFYSEEWTLLYCLIFCI